MTTQNVFTQITIHVLYFCMGCILMVLSCEEQYCCYIFVPIIFLSSFLIKHIYSQLWQKNSLIFLYFLDLLNFSFLVQLNDQTSGGVLVSSWNHCWQLISQISDILQKGIESGEKKFPDDDDVHILSIFDIFAKLTKYLRISLMKQSK